MKKKKRKGSVKNKGRIDNEILSILKKGNETSLKVNSILKRLKLNPSQREVLKSVLSGLIKENKILKEKKYYRLNPESRGEKRFVKRVDHADNKSNNLKGVIDFGMDGRLVIKSSDGGGEEIRINENKSYRLNAGDKVQYRIAKLSDDRSGKSADVLRVISSEKRYVSGKFENHVSYGIVIPDAKDVKKEIIIHSGDFNNARNGDKVYVEIINPEALNDEYTDLRGKIAEVLGKAGDRPAEEQSILRKFNLEKKFPKAVEDEAHSIKTAHKLKDRIDLRKKVVFTIDPVDAKDFDDAVSIEVQKDGTYLLGVHIADVSHYVREDSPIDKEAFKRATSVYLVKNVVPMLPEKLSNDICSLRPNVDRLTFSVFITLSKRCSVKKFEIHKTIINSKRRFTYEEAQKIIETGEGDFSKELLLMHKISKSITLKRLKEESLDFDSNEVKFEFNTRGEVEDIVVKHRLESMRLIEEFMLLANKCATLYVNDLSKKNKMHYPFVYRVHDIPNKEKLKDLSEFVKQFGYSINTEDKNSLRKLLEEIEGKPEEFIINDLLLRSMAKAIYTTTNIGHYGLGFKHYTHFTSPIRRYPDLIVHRLLYDYINPPKNLQSKIEEYKKTLPGICRHSSVMEQNAEVAERESIKLMQVDYISRHIGSQYEGIISGIVQFGMFVEIVDILVEGMIRFRDIADDYYEYNEKRHIVVGRRTGRTYRAGQRVKVRVTGVNKESRKIDFSLVRNN